MRSCLFGSLFYKNQERSQHGGIHEGHWGGWPLYLNLLTRNTQMWEIVVIYPDCLSGNIGGERYSKFPKSLNLRSERYIILWRRFSFSNQCHFMELVVKHFSRVRKSNTILLLYACAPRPGLECLDYTSSTLDCKRGRTETG